MQQRAEREEGEGWRREWRVGRGEWGGGGRVDSARERGRGRRRVENKKAVHYSVVYLSVRKRRARKAQQMFGRRKKEEEEERRGGREREGGTEGGGGGGRGAERERERDEQEEQEQESRKMTTP